MNKQEKFERAEDLIDRYMATDKIEFGPVWYDFYGKMMGSAGFTEAQVHFDNRYPIMADERISEVYA